MAGTSLRLVLGAVLLFACGPGVCPTNTTQMGERCVVNPDGGTMAQASQAMSMRAATGGGGTSSSQPAPPSAMGVEGANCLRDTDCASGHCDRVCCAKGGECCRSVVDCPTFAEGLGMTCDDPTRCHGVAGKIVCSPEFQCVVVGGTRNDSACSPSVEANDCGPYPSVYCSGRAEQASAPDCATSCLDDNGCDAEAHCSAGTCVRDVADGEACRLGSECMHGLCKNIRGGTGICCGESGDCCRTAADCPASYSQPPQCIEQRTCRGVERIAVCEASKCDSMNVASAQACEGKTGQSCGYFRDAVCRSGAAACPTSCIDAGDCDANAFCDAGKCVAKQANGEACKMASGCASENCRNGVCCAAGKECCKTLEQCTDGLEATCDEPDACQGTRRMAMCQNSICSYGSRIDDDRACNSGGNDCGDFKDIHCDGRIDQLSCFGECGSAEQCDPSFMCVLGEDGHYMCKR
jgi:hypothetical protein